MFHTETQSLDAVPTYVHPPALPRRHDSAIRQSADTASKLDRQTSQIKHPFAPETCYRPMAGPVEIRWIQALRASYWREKFHRLLFR
ncbi:MAG: hypothetical protein AAGD07_06220 [Planctomycetota bacterium]